MSLDARLSLLWIRLQNRFKTSQYLSKEIPRIAESIQPTTSADDLLQQPRLKTNTLAVTGISSVDFGKIEDMLPVVTNKRHILLGYELYVTGVFTFSRIILYDPVSLTPMPLDTFTTTAVHSAIFPQRLPVDPNWTISVYVDAYTSVGNLILTLYVIEEDAY